MPVFTGGTIKGKGKRKPKSNLSKAAKKYRGISLASDNALKIVNDRSIDLNRRLKVGDSLHKIQRKIFPAMNKYYEEVDKRNIKNLKKEKEKYLKKRGIK